VRWRRERHDLGVEQLAPATVEAVLVRLGFSAPPDADRAGLDALYLAWGRTVPFDNLVKRIDLHAGTAPFRNDAPEPFFALFLAHGVGGTCWPSSRALGVLLHSLGFDVRLGSASMADDIVGLVHSHGTVIATVEDEQLWVDSSMLTDAPVPLVPRAPSALDHPLRPVRVEPVDDLWRVRWRTGTRAGEMGCLLLADDVDAAHYSARYEWSRGMSPFNTSLYATVNRPDHVLSIGLGRRIVLDADGLHASEPLDDAARRRMLIEEFGYSAEIVGALPPDDPASV
jgi:N-hydroxyarylamine O-acetyltransferase